TDKKLRDVRKQFVKKLSDDNLSWRSPQTGSIFIVQLIEHMQEHAWRCHLEEIFREVQHAFKNNPLQMPTKERATLLKRFYLFPGH
uniref:caspase-1 n=1 Tax=Euleptes europaea TaxID=460621 RepID=UPI0025415D0A